MYSRLGFIAALLFWGLLICLPSSAGDDKDSGWTILSTPDFAAWQGNLKDTWTTAGSVTLNPENPKKLLPMPGEGILVNSQTGRSKDLLSKARFGDVELHLEFLIGKNSNSGVKFHGKYEIQILDSHGKEKVTGNDSGGIYPRAELKPKYRQIDQGIPPLVNAAKPAGEWQTLQAIFLAPRFDADGKKITNARLVKAVLNGQVIHDNVELKTPTGHLWTSQESAEGPLLLQGDHGPVAFRNVKIRPYVK